MFSGDLIKIMFSSTAWLSQMICGWACQIYLNCKISRQISKLDTERKCVSFPPLQC